MKLRNEVTLRASDLSRMGVLTMRVRYSGPFRVRLWLACVLLRVAAWVSGSTADVGREP